MLTTTANAALNIAAHGQFFRAHRGVRLRYALHGHVPYAAIGTLSQVYATHRADTSRIVSCSVVQDAVDQIGDLNGRGGGSNER